MTTNLLSPHGRSMQPLKKRLTGRNNFSKLTSCSTDDSHEAQNTDIGTKHEFTNNKGTLPKQTHTKDTLTESSNSKQYYQAENVACNPIKIEEIQESSLITVCKMEDLCKTPTRSSMMEDECNLRACKVETTLNSPQIPLFSSTLNTSLSTPLLRNIKTLQETPMSRKGKHRLSQEKSPERTPNRQKKRKVSNASDYDQLSDTIKSELCDAADFNNIEDIQLLHDLDSVMDFEDTKISTDILLSSMADNIIQNCNENHLEMSNDPPEDPLFISCDTENNENDTPTKKSQTKTNKRKSHVKKTNGTKGIKKSPKNIKAEPIKANDSSSNELTDTFADILGEIDILTENENCSEEDVKRLRELEVQLIHNVPLQHRIEHTGGSKAPTQEEKRLFLRHGPLRSGPFSPTEDQIIIMNWETFCKHHNWNPKHSAPFVCTKHSNGYYIRKAGERKNFVRFLSHGLPWRTLYSVYRRFKILYSNRNKNYIRYTAMEDEQILAYMKSKRQKGDNKTYNALAKMLGRTRNSVSLRYQLLQKRAAAKEELSSKIKWTIPLVGKFIKNLMEATLSENIEELKDATIPKPVWQKLENKLNMDQETLKTFWLHQLHMQLFCPEPIYMNDIRIKLIEYIYNKGIGNTREIIWPNVAKYFEGMTTIFLCKVFFYLVKDATDRTGIKDFLHVIEYLYQKRIPRIHNELTDKYLPRLWYENGEVTVIDDDT